MPVILTDENIEGHGRRIWMRMQTDAWRELVTDLDVTIRSFREVGLDLASADDAVWRFCQERGFYLLTSNRNAESDNSLETTMRREGTPTSLPVFTLPGPDRVFVGTDFLDSIVERLLEYILDSENIRGAGRLYLT